MGGIIVFALVIMASIAFTVSRKRNKVLRRGGDPRRAGFMVVFSGAIVIGIALLAAFGSGHVGLGLLLLIVAIGLLGLYAKKFPAEFPPMARLVAKIEVRVNEAINKR